MFTLLALELWTVGKRETHQGAVPERAPELEPGEQAMEPGLTVSQVRFLPK